MAEEYRGVRFPFAVWEWILVKDIRSKLEEEIRSKCLSHLPLNEAVSELIHRRIDSPVISWTEGKRLHSDDPLQINWESKTLYISTDLAGWLLDPRF